MTSTMNLSALINADVTLSSADDARAVFVRDITAVASVIVPELTGAKPRKGSLEQTVMADLLDGYTATGMNPKAATQARTRLLNTMRIVVANPRVAAETDADYASRVMDARTVANVGDQKSILAAIAGKGAQAKAAAKAKRADAAKAAADRKAAAADPKAAATAAAAKAAADSKAASKAAADAAKADPATAATERAALIERSMTQTAPNVRALVKAFESGEIDAVRWATFIADLAYATEFAKAAKAPVVEGTTEAPAKRTRKAKVATDAA